MIVEIEAIPNETIDPKRREERMRVSFVAEAIVLVREILTVDANRRNTKIVFRGDNYEHHAIETDLCYDAVMRIVGWRA
jgi:hypothetical protein